MYLCSVWLLGFDYSPKVCLLKKENDLSKHHVTMERKSSGKYLILEWKSERAPCRGWKIMLLCTKWLKFSLPSRGVGNSLFAKPKTNLEIVFLCHQRTRPLHISDQASLGYYLPFKARVLKQFFDAPIVLFHSSLLPAILLLKNKSLL